MPRIELLDAATISRIAAGEVVERPSAAIKELLENAIDAGSSAITIEIRGAGIEYIRVTDNGVGIESAQMRLAFERHATSKLRSGGDLLDIRNLGFRGEALNAIAQVSKVEMKSRPKEQEYGMRVVNEGGKILSLSEAGCPDGTTIIVTDLFFNTPARRNFLKKNAQETAACSDMVMREMIAHPEIAFRYIVDKKQIYHTPGDGALRTVLFCLYGRDYAAKAIPIEGERPGIHISGFVGIGELSRANRREQSFILNGRYIRNNLLSQALEQGCRMRVMQQRFPTCALHITLPFNSVDVNVHPNKLDVRFKDEAEVSRYMTEIIEASLTAHDEKNAPKFAPVKQEAPKTVAERIAPKVHAPSIMAIVDAIREGSVPEEPRSVMPETIFPKPVVAESKYSALQETYFKEEQVKPPAKLIGRLMHTYILLEREDELLFVDQHAAHERILYERFQKQYGAPQAQYLFVPEIIELGHGEWLRLHEHEPLLRDAGFVFEDFGERSIKLTAIPHFLGKPYLQEYILDVLDKLGDNPRELSVGREILIKHSCRMAVKAGDDLREENIYALLRDIEETGVNTCPHGRPILAILSKREIEKRFGRIV